MPNTKGEARVALTAILQSLPGEQVRLSNSIAIVTDTWVIVRPSRGARQILLRGDEILRVRRVRTSYPGLLVVAAGIALIAAAAYFSKEGNGAALPIAAISLFFVIAYFASRRGSVLLMTSSETIETMLGSLREAADFERTVSTLAHSDAEA